MNISDTSSILIIDDDKALSRALSLFFHVQGKNIRLTSFGSAEEAFEMLKINEYDIIICDYWLPGMNGMDFFKTIGKTQPRARKILLTSYKNDYINQKTAAPGIHRIVPKPFTKKELEILLSSEI
ncbi:MAG: response regulator [Desulfococcaceae bacterium]|jgi:DNA-binding NtrC family response regulator|nr:response regulator [Desulfococcaceae bacterium]